MGTPFILPGQNRIVNERGKFFRAAETNAFIYFVDFNEGDENGSVLMYDKKNLRLVSDNYFASADLWENLEKGNCIWISKRLAAHFKLYVEDYFANYKQTGI